MSKSQAHRAGQRGRARGGRARAGDGSCHPLLLFADDAGTIRDHPYLLAAAVDGGEATPLEEVRPIPLPRGSDLFFLPGRVPIGIDPDSRAPVALPRDERGAPAHAVAAFLAPAHTATHLVAAERRAEAPLLPLFSYAAVGFAGGRYWAAARRVDPDRRQDPWRFDRARIARRVAARRQAEPKNTLLVQLERCALEYECRAAQNFFLDRHEAPLPISTVCNARCLGCISLQPDGTFKAAHERLGRPPSAADVAAVALGHIARVARAVVSFGQGCEGEPLLMAELLREAVRRIRDATAEGTVHLNSNASRPGLVGELAAGGLDSLRVSLNSAQRAVYEAYYRPQDYGFADVVAAIAAMRERGRFVSLNLLYFPGVTDREAEIDALGELIAAHDIGMVQLRNLNIDPEVYRAAMPAGAYGPGVGLDAFCRALRARQPGLRFGYFNPPKEVYRAWEAS